MTTGEEVTIGPIEKMSKSKKNTVDPDDIIAAYGADVARWFMLSDSPPDRDVIWSDERVQERLAFRAATVAAGEQIGRDREVGPGRPAGLVRRRRAWRCARRPMARWTRCRHGIERLHFNVCLAHIREFANALADVLAKGGTRRLTSRLGGPGGLGHPCSTVRAHDAASGRGVLARCWGGPGWFRRPIGPQIERDLLVEDSVTLVVQVNGKKRGDVTVPRGAQNPEIEAAVLALDAVKSALGGKPSAR